MGRILAIIFFLGFAHLAWSQQVEVEGYFTQDSARLGERVGFVLKAKYPASSQVFFPDSTYDFSPLVLLEKKTYISATSEGTTLDSAVYYLSNFSLDPSVYLSLPVYEVNRYDSLTYFSNEAELKLKLMLDSIPEELVFRENNVYQPLDKSINWLMIGLVTGAVILLLGAFFLLFYKRIKDFIRVRTEKARWKRFQKRWEKQTQLLKSQPSIETADELTGLWKGYMEHLTGQPYQEWTSKEIAETLQDVEILKVLRALDRIIYAGDTTDSQLATDYLLDLAQKTYQEKLTRINHERTSA
ncbi:hypothetical protein [Algoriphagus taiwanensis]|uniref:Oxygen tolerance n=1 Tax=Algoriphagus taiwanensis TaxID=1445656 RepID=A0ABQ6Q7A5_9BACT|nr:hypothetical protein Ataiwa_38230 [Algoriphagus taiwanensis]